MLYLNDNETLCDILMATYKKKDNMDKCSNSKKKLGVHKKICFYLLSMVLFFIIVTILGTDIPVCFDDDAKFIGVRSCLTNKGILIPFVCIVALIYATLFALYLRHRIKGTKIGPITIINIENVNNDILAFVGTYFIPLVSFSLADNWQHLVVLCLLFIVIGIIYIRADIYYTNPTLLLLGYRVYKIEGEWNGVNIIKIVISHGELQKDDIIRYIPIDDNTYYVKKEIKK